MRIKPALCGKLMETDGIPKGERGVLMRLTLILVDVQNGFLHNADNQVMVQKIHQLLNEQLFDRVIATRYVNTAGSNIIRLMGACGLCR